MHRFRKKSDVKRSQVPDFQYTSEASGTVPALPAFSSAQPGRPHQLPYQPSELPPASDFRTSLILPDLTRRFTLLRTSSGDPVSLTDLRTRFAEQRARGAENQISEEEEDMILDTLHRIRSKTAVGKKRSGSEAEDEGNASEGGLGDSGSGYQTSASQQSIKSSSTTFGSPSTPPSTRSTKRYSNNLFGSGKSRDYTYVRSLSTRTNKSTTSSTTTAESSLSSRAGSSAYSDRPSSPDSGATSSTQSTPEKTSLARSASLASPGPYGDQSGLASIAEYRLSKTLGPSGLKRASLALDDAIKAMALIEEEAEEEILMPRTPSNRAPSGSPGHTPEHSPKPAFGQPSTEVQAGTAISSDKQVTGEIESERRSPVPMGRPGTVSPTPRLPGYIPGMPRPMTPRDTSFELDDQLSRANSTTPRASSPIIDRPAVVMPLRSPAAVAARNDSNAATTRTHNPRPTSPGTSTPLFLPRSVNGRFTPTDDHHRNGSGTIFSPDHDSSISSSILGSRRRPASPLSTLHFQPMAVSPRPGTPSNITWNLQPNSSPAKNQENHSRNGSWTSGVGIGSDMHDVFNSQEGGLSTSLRSPALPDSPMIFDLSQGDTNGQGAHDNRPTSRGELGSPVSIQNRVPRSPTPTQNTPRSAYSPTFTNYDVTSSGMNGSRLSSNQNTPPFSFGATQPLIFSPIANSSRSSLESAGSSYHSWDGGLQKDRGIDLLISDVEPHHTVWHDVGGTDKNSDDDEFDEEAIIGQYAGLTKADFVAIQEKLVAASIAKSSTPAPRDRAPSLRRRRPSTSQSNYSLNGFDSRVSSPPPHAQNQVLAETVSPQSDNTSKANALLDLVVNSIPSPRNQGQNITNHQDQASDPSAGVDFSNVSQRNRDLADALFGVPREDRKSPPPRLTLESPGGIPRITIEEDVVLTTDFTPQRDGSGSSSETEEASSLSPSPPYIRSATAPPDQAELAREVKRKTEVAMAQLRRAPSQSEAHSPGSTRKHVNPSQISSPRLVAATTSVDTIPLRSPSVASVQQGSKIASGFGQGLRKLRGSLRSKPTAPNGNQVRPYPLEIQSPSPIQVAHYNRSKLHHEGPGAMSATELGGFKSPVIPNQPASAGPTLKGFMARFRKPRAAGLSPELERRGHPQSHSVNTSSSSSPHGTSTPEQIYSAPATHDSFDLHSSERPRPAGLTPLMPNLQSAEPNPRNQRTAAADDADQRRKLFEAASNLGLDPTALNDLLSRSAPLSRNTSTMSPSRPQPQSSTGNGLDRSKSLTAPTSQSADAVTTRSTENVGRKSSFRKRGEQARTVREGGATASAIVRRTIIIPSEQTSTIDLNLLMRKNAPPRQRGSGSMQSSRSVHDRAPTPPPPRSPTSKRFSHDSPPVPQLPPSMSTQAENLLHVPQSGSAAGQIEKSSSTYDSLYEMYAGERKSVTSIPGDTTRPAASLSSQSVSPDNMIPSESGPAIELIELANGETIWSIVNGLRDDDMDSVYPSRGSFASEHSAQEEGVQVRFKHHSRSGSTGSASSSAPKKPGGNTRPETKVFYSSSAQIGRLIENLSLTMEAGSFKFSPATSQSGQSNASSFHSGSENWTVEETLERMLDSMRSS